MPPEATCFFFVNHVVTLSTVTWHGYCNFMNDIHAIKRTDHGHIHEIQ